MRKYAKMEKKGECGKHTSTIVTTKLEPLPVMAVTESLQGQASLPTKSKNG